MFTPRIISIGDHHPVTYDENGFLQKIDKCDGQCDESGVFPFDCELKISGTASYDEDGFLISIGRHQVLYSGSPRRLRQIGDISVSFHEFGGTKDFIYFQDIQLPLLLKIGYDLVIYDYDGPQVKPIEYPVNWRYVVKELSSMQQKKSSSDSKCSPKDKDSREKQEFSTSDSSATSFYSTGKSLFKPETTEKDEEQQDLDPSLRFK